MAVDISPGVGQRYDHSSPGVTAMPLTLAGWFNPDDITTGSCVVSVADTSTSNNVFALQFSGNVAGDPVRALLLSPGGNGVAASGTFSADSWQHGAAVFTSTTSRKAYLDGVGVEDTATSGTPSGIDSFDIGRVGDLTPSAEAEGQIAEVGVWDVALTDAEIAALAARATPDQVRPQNLVHYYKLIDTNDTIAYFGTTALTRWGAPPSAAHPPVHETPPSEFEYPATEIIFLSPTVGSIWKYTAANWSGRTWHFEGIARHASGGTVSVKLYDLTAAADVANSTVLIKGSTRKRVRSAAITLVDGNEYEARFGTPGGTEGKGVAARLIGIN